jgi:hypothetical protein
VEEPSVATLHKHCRRGGRLCYTKALAW